MTTYGKGGWQRKTFESNRVNPEFLFKDLQTSIMTLSFDSAVASDARAVQLSDVKSVASYSWIEAATPTIAVPGSPRVWRGINIARVPLDQGEQFVHHDASKMDKQSPLLPLFVAIDALHDDFPYNDVDLIINRNTFRKLLSHINKSRDAADFRIDIDLVQNTCVLTRREENNTEDPGSRSGFGHEYLKAATRAPSIAS
ncbi:hypothetical protein HYDPIDRAFT_107267 [Hydnomerulius pinastri MD-312]|nr:hypothetical protein HYDPIDRAFT_107267 [Hydnomerulius pinastri MD-312]